MIDNSYFEHSDCVYYWEKLHDEYECGEGHWWWETGCYNGGDVETFSVCENFREK